MKRISRSTLRKLLDSQQYPRAVRVNVGESYVLAYPTCTLYRGGLLYKVLKWHTLDTLHATVFIGPIKLVVMSHEKTKA